MPWPTETKLKPPEPIRDKDHVIDFGKKHLGRTVGELMIEDPDYLLYCHEHMSTFELHADLHDQIDLPPEIE